jgi:hypothetical protein
VVVDGCDRWSDAVAERLAAGPAAEVVVATRPDRLRNDLELAGIGSELGTSSWPSVVVSRRGGARSDPRVRARVAAAFLVGRRDDVEPVRDFVGPVDNPSESADDDVHRLVLIERLQRGVWVEVRDQRRLCLSIVSSRQRRRCRLSASRRESGASVMYSTTVVVLLRIAETSPPCRGSTVRATDRRPMCAALARRRLGGRDDSRVAVTRSVSRDEQA